MLPKCFNLFNDYDLLDILANLFVCEGILYVSTSTSSNAKERLEAAVSSLLSCFHSSEALDETSMSAAVPKQPKVLYSVYYEQASASSHNFRTGRTCTLASPSLDLAFNDATLDNVEEAWQTVMELTAGNDASQSQAHGSFMIFQDREPMSGQEDDYEGT